MPDTQSRDTAGGSSPESSSPGPVQASTLDLQAVIREVDSTLKAMLASYADVMPASLVAMGKQALMAPGKVMPAAAALEVGDTRSITPRWPLCVLLACHAAAGASRPDAWRDALPAAAAVEVAMAAADLIDEVADEDPSPFVKAHGAGQALNTGNLMLVMAQQMLARAVEEQTPVRERALAALGALQEMLVRAATGQHLDMLYEDMPLDAVDLEMSAHMTGLKAGALVAGAFRVGALMSGAEGHVVDVVTRVGQELGSISQISNDIQDVLPLPGPGSIPEGAYLPDQKTDLRHRKRTIPIVFALRDDRPEPNPVQRAFAAGRRSQDEDEDEAALRAAVSEAGGIRFATLVSEVHRQRALEALDELEALRPGAIAILSPLMPEPPPAPDEQ